MFDAFPCDPKNMSGAAKIDIEEVCIPRELRTYKFDLALLSSIWRPVQAMVNLVTSELTRASSTVPAYRAYVIPDLSKRPWVPLVPEHERSMANWSHKMKGLRSGQPMNMQSFIFYRIRFIIAADLAGAFRHFGGVVAQWNLLGIVLNLAIIESPFIDMEYDRLIHVRVANLASEHYGESDTSINYFSILSHEQSEIRRSIVNESNGYLRHKGGFKGGKNDSAATPPNAPTPIEPTPIPPKVNDEANFDKKTNRPPFNKRYFYGKGGKPPHK